MPHSKSDGLLKWAELILANMRAVELSQINITRICIILKNVILYNKKIIIYIKEEIMLVLTTIFLLIILIKSVYFKIFIKKSWLETFKYCTIANIILI